VDKYAELNEAQAEANAARQKRKELRDDRLRHPLNHLGHLFKHDQKKHEQEDVE
jgi:hypothetical protein